MKQFINSYINFLEKRKKVLLILFLVCMVLSFILLPAIKIDFSTEGFLFPDDPILLKYVEFQKYFGNDSIILLTINGNVFSNEYLKKIDALQRDIETTVPYIKKITSIINAPQLYTEIDTDGISTLYVDDLLQGFPQTEFTLKQLNALKQTVLSDPTYINQIVSEDGNTSTIILELYSKKELEYKDNAKTSTNEDTNFEEFDTLFDDIDKTENTNTNDKNQDAESTLSLEETQEPSLIYTSPFLSDEQNKEIRNAVLTLKKIHIKKNFEIAVVGFPLLVPTMTIAFIQDVLILIPILLVVIVLVVFLMFRRLSAVLFALIVSIFTNVAIFGAMSLNNTPITLVSNIIPVTMISISLGALIHLLMLMFNKYDAGKTRRESLIYAFQHSSWPIILTSLTSAIGIFSFFFSGIKPIHEFGLFGALGLLFSLLITLSVIPLFFLALPIKRKTKKQSKTRKVFAFINMEKLLTRHASYILKHRLFSIIISILIIGISFMGIRNVYFSHKPLNWFPKTHPFRVDTEKADAALKGSNFLDIFIDTKEEGGIYNIDFLEKIETLETYLMNYSGPLPNPLKVGKVLFLNTILKKTNQVLNNNDPVFFRIPKTRELVAQELLLLENGGMNTLDNFVDVNYRYYRMTITVPDLDAVLFSQFLKDVEDKMAVLFSNTPYTYYSTGSVSIQAKIINATITSSATSYLVAFGLITILMILLSKNIIIGLVSMIPNLLPVFVLLGIVGFTNINLDIFILLIGCVLLGIAVDNTIHFVHVFRNYYDEIQKDHANNNTTISSLAKPRDIYNLYAIKHTFLSTNKAMLTSSIILISGFSIFIPAAMRNLHNFGILAMIGVIIALFSDFFLTPALMSYLTDMGFITRRNKHKSSLDE